MLRPDDPFEDHDPWPRPAPVGLGSAYAALPAAVTVAPGEVTLGVPAPTERRRRTPLRSWRFAPRSRALPASRLVSVPHAWSRRDAGLTDFRGPASYEREVRVGGPFARVVLDQVDYLAKVDVDGTTAVRHEGGFTPIAVDVPAGRDVLVSVEVDDPLEEILCGPDPLLAPKRKIKGVFEQHDSRPGGVPLGDVDPLWARRWGTGGLTGPAWLHETGPVRIVDCFLTPASGLLRVSWVLENLGEDTDAELVLALDGATAAIAARLPTGASRVSVRFHVEGASGWTPEEPNLYAFHTVVRAAGAASDALEVPVGFREIAMATGGPEQFQLRIDGRRTYVRAANYIPGLWLDELTAETVRRDVALAKAAGLNSLGVHAHVCPPLYDIADREGVLVYQDFPLQWFYDAEGGPLFEGGPTFAQASLELAAELVYARYNHPSIVYWCGHNEPAYQLAELFETAQVPELAAIADRMTACPDESELDGRRARLFAEIDPSRPSFAASGLGGSRPDGDVHDYAGALSGGHVTSSRAGRTAFVSEFGAWSAHFSAAAEAPGAAGDWPPPPEAGRDWGERTHVLPTQLAFAGRPERFEDFATWCFAGQLWAGWHAKLYTEAARLAKWSPSGGQRYHFFVDHWGAAGAGVVDRHRTVGPAYLGLAAANRPVVAIAPCPPGGRVVPGAALRLPITVVNDLHRDLGTLPLRWRLAALDADDAFLVGGDDPGMIGVLEGSPSPDDQCAVLPRRPGRTLLEGELEVRVGPDALVQAAEVAWPADVEGSVALFMDLDGVESWTSFVVAPDGWSATPGLSGPRRFTVTAEAPGELRERWTGTPADASAAPPGQYRLGDVLVDVFDDVVVHADGRVETSPLPWPIPDWTGMTLS